jgi:hypothetical protein
MAKESGKKDDFISSNEREFILASIEKGLSLFSFFFLFSKCERFDNHSKPFSTHMKFSIRFEN